MSFCVKVCFFWFSLNKLTSWHLGLRWGAWGEVGMAANLDEASQRRMAMSPMPPFTNVQNSDNFKDKFLHFMTSFLQCQCHGVHGERTDSIRSDTLQAEGLFGLECGLRSTVPLHFCRFCRCAFSSRNDSNFNIYLMYFGMLSISLHTKARPCFLQRPRWLCFFAQSDTRRDLDSKPQDVHVICRMGLPYFSVFRMNVDIMLLGCTLDSPTSCFSCEVMKGR